jgi:hypothetical protein
MGVPSRPPPCCDWCPLGSYDRVLSMRHGQRPARWAGPRRANAARARVIDRQQGHVGGRAPAPGGSRPWRLDRWDRLTCDGRCAERRRALTRRRRPCQRPHHRSSWQTCQPHRPVVCASCLWWLGRTRRWPRASERPGCVPEDGARFAAKPWCPGVRSREPTVCRWWLVPTRCAAAPAAGQTVIG